MPLLPKPPHPFDPMDVGETDEGRRIDAGVFCNYDGPSAHIDAQNLTTGEAWTRLPVAWQVVDHERERGHSPAKSGISRER